MRATKFTLSILLGFCSLGLLIWAFGPNVGANSASRVSPPADPDLPPGNQPVDKQAYLAARAEWLLMRRGFNPNFPFDPATREQAISEMSEQLKQLEAERLARLADNPDISTNSWTAVGPAPVPVNVGGEGPWTGRVISIAVHPTNPSIVYVGTASGGLYRTLDGQAASPTWTPMFDTVQLQSNGAPAIGTLAIGAIAFAPSNPDIVYVGTGEHNDTFGSGLYRIDGATTGAPTIAGPVNPAADYGDGRVLTAFKFSAIAKIAVHPTNPGTIFVGTSAGGAGSLGNPINSGGILDSEAVHGVYRSTNATAAAGAITFTKLKVNNQLGATTGDTLVPDLVLDPSDPTGNTLLVWAMNQGGGGPCAATDCTGVWRSTNALSGTPTTFTQTLMAATRNVKGKFAVAQVGGIVTVLAATGEAPAAPTACTTKGRLRRSIDGGVTWPNADAASASQGGWVRAADGFCGDQCGYDLAVVMAPANTSLFQVGGQYQDGCSVVTKRSVDGVNMTLNAAGVHADIQLLTTSISNPSIVWLGGDGGVWRSTDAGANWVNMNGNGATSNNPAGKINAMQYVSIATHPTDREFMTGGTQDNGSHLKRSAATGGLWRVMAFGDGGYTAIDNNATNTANVRMYHTYYGAGYEFVATTMDDEALNWTNRDCVPGGAASTRLDCSDRVLFYPPMVLGPGNPNALYFGTDRLYRSSNGGDTIQLVSQGPLPAEPSGPQMTSISVGLGNDNVRLAGMRDGRVWMTTTGSNVLTDVTPPDVYVGADVVGKVMVDPNNTNPGAITAYVAYGSFGWGVNPFGVPPNTVTHLYKTTNLAGGASTWVDMSNGLPNVPVNAIAIDRKSATAPNAGTSIYLGTDIGVYRSTDGGANWAIYNPGNTLPIVPVSDMAFQEQGGVGERILRIATIGRGVWEIQTTGTNSPAALSGVFSRKMHGASGTFDVNLVSAPSVECRSGGANGDYTLVFSFANTLASVGGASVTAGTGFITSSGVDGGDAHNYLVNLTGVTNAQRVTVTLANVTDSGGGSSSAVPITMGVLLGDINSSGGVNATDIGQTKAASGQVVSGSNFRQDVNVSGGSINASDIGSVKARSGTSLP